MAPASRSIGRVRVMVGGGSVDRMANAPLAALLTEHFTVFNYDRRGRGDSGDTAPYAVEREIEDIEPSSTKWIRAVYGDQNGPKSAFWWSVELRQGRVRDLFGQFRKVHSPKFGSSAVRGVLRGLVEMIA